MLVLYLFVFFHVVTMGEISQCLYYIYLLLRFGICMILYTCTFLYNLNLSLASSLTIFIVCTAVLASETHSSDYVYQTMEKYPNNQFMLATSYLSITNYDKREYTCKKRKKLTFTKHGQHKSGQQLGTQTIAPLPRLHNPQKNL